MYWNHDEHANLLSTRISMTKKNKKGQKQNGVSCPLNMSEFEALRSFRKASGGVNWWRAQSLGSRGNMFL